MRQWMKSINYLLIGRSGQITDVFIDSFGVLIGSFICLMIYKILKKIKRKDGALPLTEK